MKRHKAKDRQTQAKARAGKQSKTRAKKGFFPFASGHRTQAKRITSPQSPIKPRYLHFIPIDEGHHHPTPERLLKRLKTPILGRSENCTAENAPQEEGQRGSKEDRQTRGQGDEGTQQDTPPPPLWEGRGCLSAPLKFAPYFCQNLSLCNSILQKRKVGLENHGENTFCVQENVEKRGILGKLGASWGASRD